MFLYGFFIHLDFIWIKIDHVIKKQKVKKKRKKIFNINFFYTINFNINTLIPILFYQMSCIIVIKTNRKYKQQIIIGI